MPRSSVCVFDHEVITFDDKVQNPSALYMRECKRKS